MHVHSAPVQGTAGLEATEYNFDEISLVDDVPDRDFTLAAFGFPELGQPKPRPTGGPVLWLFVFGCLAMAAAVTRSSWRRRDCTRRRRRPDSDPWARGGNNPGSRKQRDFMVSGGFRHPRS